MDNTPDYMSSLEIVAMRHGQKANVTYLGSLLAKQWEHFETVARGNSYDIFVSIHLDYAGIRRAMQDLTETLYLIPGANWSVDCATIRAKDADYGGSWCKRGGQGAFFMLSRKWDRIQKQVTTYDNDLSGALAFDTREEGIRDDLNDLRCYLLLVLSWHEATENPKVTMLPAPEEDHPF